MSFFNPTSFFDNSADPGAPGGVPWYSNPNFLNPASLALGALGTGTAAYGAYNTQNQQNQIRNQALNAAQAMANPGTMVGQAQTYFNAAVPSVNQAAQNLLQQQIAPIEGMRGYDPRSGQGQLVYAQAVAPLYWQAWQQAVNDAQRGAAGSLGGLQTASGNVNMMMGNPNALPNAIQGLALNNALAGLGAGLGRTASTVASALPAPSNLWNGWTDPATLPATPAPVDWSTPGEAATWDPYYGAGAMTSAPESAFLSSVDTPGFNPVTSDWSSMLEDLGGGFF